jgi:peptidyl-dipeptidase A
MKDSLVVAAAALAACASAAAQQTREAGQRQIDGGALLEYFQPLQGWLKQQNQGKQCGW